MKCEKCIGRGYWHVFKGNTVNGGNDENQLVEYTCPECQGSGEKKED